MNHSTPFAEAIRQASPIRLLWFLPYLCFRWQSLHWQSLRWQSLHWQRQANWFQHLRFQTLNSILLVIASLIAVAVVSVEPVHAEVGPVPVGNSTEDDTPIDGNSQAWPATFDFDVMAVLSKSGCNQGTCHGNQNGKGGFYLSLRGENPSKDFQSLTREYGGRRINWFEPSQSLVLTKGAARVAHRGGQRFSEDSQEYRILEDWIDSGAERTSQQAELAELEVTPVAAVLEPGQELQIKVTAILSTGERRDVSGLTVFTSSNPAFEVSSGGKLSAESPGETTVVARFLNLQEPVSIAIVPSFERIAEEVGIATEELQLEFQQQIADSPTEIDRLIHQKLAKLRQFPAEICSDRVFLRRTYLDLLGRLPDRFEAIDFLDEQEAGKRERLVEKLLKQPEFAQFWALKWSDLLRNEEKVLDKKGVRLFYDWIQESIEGGKPLNEFAHELVASRGSTYEVPQANYYRGLRDPFARGEATARLFLGVRLGCAKCHNHPFEKWTQDDYYDWAAVFATVDYEILENERRDKLDKNEFNGEQIVKVGFEGAVKNPRTTQTATPRFLGLQTSLGEETEGADRLQQLADWLVSPDNRRFAEVQANLIWYHLMGQGLVEPIDDFRLTNQPTNPALLAHLADRLVESNYDLRSIVRDIVLSEAYQRSAEPHSTLASDETNYGHVVIRRLTAEQLLDAQNQVIGSKPQFGNFQESQNAISFPGAQVPRNPKPEDLFLKQFGKPTRLLGCECERSNETTLAQAFALISGRGLERRLSDPENDLTRWVLEDRPEEEIVTVLFWRSLSRAPSAQEKSRGVALIEAAATRLEGVQDLAWSLLNAKEFVFRP